MAYINGRLYTCDRCGNKTFCKCVGEGETDGGYTRWNKFEPLPEGWGTHYDVGLLCPHCSPLYDEMIRRFKKVSNAIVTTDNFQCAICEHRYWHDPECNDCNEKNDWKYFVKMEKDEA